MESTVMTFTKGNKKFTLTQGDTIEFGVREGEDVYAYSGEFVAYDEFSEAFLFKLDSADSPFSHLFDTQLMMVSFDDFCIPEYLFKETK